MKYNRGYTLLFAVLTAALVLGVASFILGFARKQSILSSTAKESMYAIYAADSGMECMMLYLFEISSSSPSSINCNGVVLSVQDQVVVEDKQVAGEFYDETSWSYDYLDLRNGTCAKMSVIFGKEEAKRTNGTPYARPYTRYEARGYNKCVGEGQSLEYDSAFPRIVERAMQITDHGIW